MERVEADRRRQALQLNDDVLQSLLTAKVAWELGAHDQVGPAIDASLEALRAIVHDLIAGVIPIPEPGQFVRTQPAPGIANPAATDTAPGPTSDG